MIVIGICDGEQTIRSLLASYVERYCRETGSRIQLLSYSTGEKLLKNYMLDLDLVFLEIPLRKMNGLYKIYHHQIRYIETWEKNTLIHTERDDIPSSRQMKQFEQLLSGTSLIRCHTSYIVNLRYFEKLEQSTIILTDGTRIPVSRSRKAQVVEQICSLYGEN